jgi:hypothetical protein
MRYVYVRVFVCSFVFELHTWKTHQICHVFKEFAKSRLRMLCERACLCMCECVCLRASFFHSPVWVFSYNQFLNTITGR